MEIPILKKEADIRNCIKTGRKFKIAPSVKQLDITISAALEYYTIAEAILESTLTHVKIITVAGGSGITKLVNALASLETLHSLIFHAKTAYEDALPDLGQLIMQNSTLRYLDVITGFCCVNSTSFLSGLAHNTGLEQVMIRTSGVSYLFSRYAENNMDCLMSALASNPSISNFSIKSLVDGRNISRDDAQYLSKKHFFASVTKTNIGKHPSDLVIFLERKPQSAKKKDDPLAGGPNTDMIGSYIKGSNWEELAKFIKETCEKRVIEQIYPQELNLNTKAFVDKLAIHSLKQVIDNMSQDHITLSVVVDEATKHLQSLFTERVDLQRRLQLVESKIGEVEVQLKNDTNLLAAKRQSQETLSTNLKTFQTSYEKTEPELKKWQQKLRTDFGDWSCDDISFLLSEIGLSQYSATFITNKIDGSVLQALDANDLISTLQVAFKDAKKLQMYIYMVENHHDIYSTPIGVLQWNNDTVCTWLEDNKFGHLVDVFKKHEITGAELVFLEKADLTGQLQIKALGDTVKLQKELTKLKASFNDESALQAQLKNTNNNNNEALTRQLEEMKRANEELNQALKKLELKIPDAFICPITQDIMNDPVFASDGHTYERTAIELWLKNNNSSPMTGLQLSNKQLTPSHTLKSMIREFIDANKKK